MAETDWKESLKSETAFNTFINNYFKDHKQLTGNYETRSYYENYTVTLNSKKGLVITLLSSVNPTFSQMPQPFQLGMLRPSQLRNSVS